MSEEIAACDVTKHKWVEEYYGLRCSVCKMFVPDGMGPWMPMDDEMEGYDDDYPYESRECPNCAGEDEDPEGILDHCPYCNHGFIR